MEIPNFVWDFRTGALTIQRRSKSNWVWQKRDWKNVTGIDVHHAAFEATAERIIEAAAQHGVQTSGVPFGYHIIVETGGTVHLCANLDDVVYHNGGGGSSGKGWSVANDTRVGVCFSGNFVENPDGPNRAQREAFKRVYSWLVGEGMPESVRGHRDWKATQCPGTNWDAWKMLLIPEKIETPTETDEYKRGWNDALGVVAKGIQNMAKK